MTLGAGALAKPLAIQSAPALHAPWLFMLAALALVLLLSWRSGALSRKSGAVLIAAYPLFIALVLLGAP